MYLVGDTRCLQVRSARTVLLIHQWGYTFKFFKSVGIDVICDTFASFWGVKAVGIFICVPLSWFAKHGFENVLRFSNFDCCLNKRWTNFRPCQRQANWLTGWSTTLCSYWPIVRSIRENIWTAVLKYGPNEVRSVRKAKVQIFSRMDQANWSIRALLYRCTIKIFRGGKGWWMGWGVSVKDAWSGVVGSGGSLRDLSKNILKQGVGKGKSCS